MITLDDSLINDILDNYEVLNKTTDNGHQNNSTYNIIKAILLTLEIEFKEI